jgi:hypothetical protein
LKKRFSIVLTAAVLTVGTVAILAPSATARPISSAKPAFSADKLALIQYLKTHGYLPLRGADTLARAKAHAAAVMAAQTGKPVASAPAHGAAPIIGASWQGVSNAGVSPPDPNGAIGPNSYIEIINQNISIYNRSGGLISTAGLTTLTGDFGGFLSDPMILWDPQSQRFYYNVWDVGDSKMDWGFSKDTNPTSIPSSWCGYIQDFGYNPSIDIPDYPKLGQTKDFLLIGVNHYPSFSSLHADRTDLLWINKYTNPAPVTTCPAASTFGDGIFKDLRNGDNTVGFTPVPAIQTDASGTGWVITESDIECPDICGTGTKISVHALRANPNNPLVPQFKIKGSDITVGSFMAPPDAPQKGSSDLLDTLDGRMTHAVSGIDPGHSNRTGVWVAHTVAGGAGSMIKWYEINPLPVNNPTLLQSGTVSDTNLWIHDAGISNDRACDLTSCTHGDNMVLGFSTSSSTAFPASQMVSKVGAGAQSAFVVVKQSTTFDNDFTCAPVCRWGDYGGATPDPTKKTGSVGEVWLTNEWTNGTNQTWNWEATP